MGQCGSKKRANVDGGDGGAGQGAGVARDRDVAINGKGRNGNASVRGQKRVTIIDDKNVVLSPRPQPLHSDMVSHGSGRSSVYFDTCEGGSEDWQSLNVGDSFDDTFVTLEIDGQFFFNAKDDPNLSKDAFEGIHLYPPLPTTEPDPLPRSPISVTNMQTLLHTYQHSGDDEDALQSKDEADAAYEKAGKALEHQAQRLMSLNERKSAEYFGQSTNQLLKDLKIPNVREKGFPGELTEKELEAVKLFQSELKSRDPIYNEIVRSLSVVEKEAYALCRWLRARKFDVDKVFELLDEAKDHYMKAKESDFYPDLEQSLGISRPIFLSQYPAVYSGNAKNGCPVLYMTFGQIQPEGIKCIVTLDKVDRFFWNDTMHSYPPILLEGRRLNPNFVRTENITVYDLKGVNRSQITSDTFEMIKIANQVMCSFPETLHCLLIINAPSWFGFVWSVVKKLIDPRTASKIEVFTNAKAGNKRMLELIDESQIVSDYGGSGPSLAEAASGGGAKSSGERTKMVVLNQLLTLPKKNSEKIHIFELDDEKQLTLTIYTRCKSGCMAALFHLDNLVTEIEVTSDKDDEPYSRTLGAVSGPGSFTVKLKANTSPGSFLCLGTTTSG